MESIERAHRQMRLWPSIHAATDVFLRRRAAGAEPFELVWRLVHIWECTSITLAGAGTARVLSLTPEESQSRALRERLHGRVWDESEGELVVGQGALGGSIDKWLDILEFLTKESASGRTSGQFLSCLGEWLGNDEHENLVDLAPLVTGWARVCEVPPKADARHTPLRALRLVNTFRNRFAHVPFPIDPIPAVLNGLTTATDDLMRGACSKRSPLAGVLIHRGCAVVGSTTWQCQGSNSEELMYGYDWSKGVAVEVWEAKPFAYLDQMFRPYVLSRLRDSEGSWEYTRYLAESNAVVIRPDARALELVPVPHESEYHHKNPRETATAEDPMTQAMLAIKDRRFDQAIECLRGIVRDHPNYHVAWLRLGLAHRGRAISSMHEGSTGSDGAVKDLAEAVECLQKASNHVESWFRAEALYQLSKTYFRIGRDPTNIDARTNAVRLAKEALSVASESRFETWLEYLSSIDEYAQTPV